MFSKSIFAFAFVAVAQLATAAMPPPCLLSALMTLNDPSKVAAICKDSKMPGMISDACQSDTQAAMSSFAATCKAAGVTVESTSASSSAAASSTKASSDSPSSTNASAASSVSSSAVSSGASSAASTGKSASGSTLTTAKSAATTAKPSTVIVAITTASYDSSCSCSKTAVISSTAVVTPTESAAQATGTGAAGRVEIGALGVLAGIFGVVAAVL